MNILLLGDSITQGWTVPGGYRAPLFDQLVNDAGLWVNFVGDRQVTAAPDQWDVDHQGRNGITAQEVLQNIDGILDRNPNDIAFVLLGTNEVLHQSNPVETVPGRLLNIIREIADANPAVQIFLGTLPPINNTSNQLEVDQINAQLPGIIDQAVAEGINVTLVSFDTLGLEDLSDGLHPNAAGFLEMATEISNAFLDGTTQSVFTLNGQSTPIDGITSVIGSNEGDLLLGSQDADSLEGGNGRDVLEGRAGDDDLNGGADGDLIIGGEGDDTLTGGAGDDIFYFTASHQGTDTVTDFAASDTIKLFGFGFSDVSEAAANLSVDGANIVFTRDGVTIIFENTTLTAVTNALELGEETEHEIGAGASAAKLDPEDFIDSNTVSASFDNWVTEAKFGEFTREAVEGLSDTIDYSGLSSFASASSAPASLPGQTVSSWYDSIGIESAGLARSVHDFEDNIDLDQQEWRSGIETDWFDFG